MRPESFTENMKRGCGGSGEWWMAGSGGIFGQDLQDETKILYRKYETRVWWVGQVLHAGIWGNFWTGLTGFSGFIGLEQSPQRIYEMN